MRKEPVKKIRIGRYEVQESFRAGEPAEFVQGATQTRVYRARIVSRKGLSGDVPDEVALKVFTPPSVNADKFRVRFRQEGVIGKMLEHPNIIRFIESGSAELNGKTVEYHAMELGGENLSQFVNRRKNKRRPISIEEAFEIAEQIANAIDFVHSKGIVLRDLKPTNFVDLKPTNFVIGADGTTVKLIDFDNAWIIGGPGARDRVGSSIFAAPEHYPDLNLTSTAYAVPASDIFAFGKIIFFLFTSQYPQGVNALPIDSLPEPRASELWADEVCRTLHAATRTDPSARYQSAVELVEDLRSAISESRAPATEEGEDWANEDFVRKLAASRRARRRRRRRFAAAIVVVSVFAMIIISALVVRKQLIARVPKPPLRCTQPPSLIGRTIISKTNVNLRAGPSPRARVLCVMNAGTSALVLGETTNKWARVRITRPDDSPGSSCQTGTEGYSYVEFFTTKCE